MRVNSHTLGRYLLEWRRLENERARIDRNGELPRTVISSKPGMLLNLLNDPSGKECLRGPLIERR